MKQNEYVESEPVILDWSSQAHYAGLMAIQCSWHTHNLCSICCKYTSNLTYAVACGGDCKQSVVV